MGRYGGGASWWIILIFVLYWIYAFFLWWVAFLPFVGEVSNGAPSSDLFDPTTIKWLYLALLIVTFIFLVIAFFMVVLSDQKQRQSLYIWHFGILFFLVLVLTIWVFLWDDRNADLWADGVPKIVPFPSPCNPACRTLHALQETAYIYWFGLLAISFLVFSWTLFAIFYLGAYSKGSMSPAARMLANKRIKSRKGIKLNDASTLFN
ncbi:hypothetical protein LCGC14_2082590 [marine sediment metagenome]|uniref:Uncharacterized protein n=1 Tax=marine sediment metagenome TaxID=412755 RepID=A0A0F9EFC6_9ZZZZ